jgi:5'-deoxynucleotidase YfbR-like HD superfamily hydrolase
MRERTIYSAQVTEILEMRAAGYVTRYHTLRHLGSQNDAEHSAQALVLLMMLHPNPSKNLIWAVLCHDMAELYAGDSPAPALRLNDKFREGYHEVEATTFRNVFPSANAAITTLTAEELNWLKAVDRLELVLWCRDQIEMGNTHAAPVESRGKQYLLQNNPPAEVTQFLTELYRR